MSHPITVRVSNPVRGAIAGDLPPEFLAKSFNWTTSWGVGSRDSAVASIEYVPPDNGWVPAAAGSVIEVTTAGHRFAGIVVRDVRRNDPRAGRTRTIECTDFRAYLHGDWIHGAFNIRETRLIDGTILRQYRHLYPEHWDTNTTSITNSPLTGRQILDICFGFTRRFHRRNYTVETEWLRNYHPSLNQPVYDLDFNGGVTLAAAVQAVCDQLGLVVGIVEGDPDFTLTFVRKGEGDLPTYVETGSEFPPGSNGRRDGTSTSGAPTRVRVVGDRNRYQVHDIVMVPDWAVGWNTLADTATFEDDLFRRATVGDADPSTGSTVRLNAMAGDADQLTGRFLAASLARTITVRQYAELRWRTRLPGDAIVQLFQDFRPYAGRPRADMPAVLYINTILFRAFRPEDSTTFPIASNAWVPLASMQLSQRLLTAVTHNPVTGEMAVDLTAPAEGVGYAIAQGYRVGADAFATVKPERFDLSRWQDAQLLWQHIPFTAGTSDWDAIPYILFDEPVIRSDGLIEMVDGVAVLRANPQLVVPYVRACLVFECEKFSHVAGEGGWDHVEHVSGLNGEYVTTVGSRGCVEIPFADGELVRPKAQRIAAALLSRPPVYIEGGFVRVADDVSDDPAHLTPLIDRVTLAVSSQGTQETVEFTRERRGNAFETERSLDRRSRMEELLPGQADLLRDARTFRQLAAAVRSDRSLGRTLSQVLRGTEEPLIPLSGAPANAPALEVGTPLWRAPGTGGLAQYRPDDSAVVFEGVTVRQQESPLRPLPRKSTGLAFARVAGPVPANGVIGRATGDDAGKHLVSGGSVSVGRSMAEVPAGQVKLVPVVLGMGGGGAAAAKPAPFQLLAASGAEVKEDDEPEVKGEKLLPHAKVNPGTLLTGLDWREQVAITGLDKAFSLEAGSSVWIELYFDFGPRPACVFAVVARSVDGWDGYPKAVFVARKTGATDWLTTLEERALETWVGFEKLDEESGETVRDDDAIKAKVAELRKVVEAFPNTPNNLNRQMLGIIPVAESIDPESAEPMDEGIDLVQTHDDQGEEKDPVEKFRMVQLTASNLMLAGFCDNGVPVQAPVPWGRAMPAVV